jgi:uncharacterized protein with PIN domain
MNREPTNKKFMADHMLGSLARWLRMMGYDCRYEKGLADDDIIDICEKENRILLTRDEELATKSKGFCLRTTSLDEQLLEVSRSLDLKFNPSNMRCSLCNGPLVRIDRDKAAAEGGVPQRSLDIATEFWQCDSCKKIYWNGTHWDGILGRFKRLGLAGDDE